MKKLYHLFLIAMFTLSAAVAATAFAQNTPIPIDSLHFPDPVFRECVKQLDDDNDGFLTFADRGAITRMGTTSGQNNEYSLPLPLNISDLTGVEYFHNLTSLQVGNRHLTSLDVSQNTELEILCCDYNLLLSLDVSGCTKLKDLRCAENLLTNLDVRQNTELTFLGCSQNQLTSLDVSQNTELTELNCCDNQLTSLDVSSCKKLKDFYCCRNLLSSLNVSGCEKLIHIECGGNLLTSLDISGLTRLGGLSCENNLLTKLDASGLNGLSCDNNLLTKLDVSKTMVVLSCNNNRLKSLDVSGCKQLEELYCSNNQLRHLDVNGCEKLWCLEADSNHLPLSELYAMANRKNYVLTPQSDTANLSIDEALDLSREMKIDTTRTQWCITDTYGADLPGCTFYERNGIFYFLRRRECKLVLTNAAVRDNDTTVTFTWIVNVPGKPVNIALQPNNAQWGEVSGYGEHERNADVTIVATPKDGYRFVEWQKEEVLFCTKPDTTFKAREHLTLTAVFEPIPTYAVELQVNNTEWGETLGSGVYREDSTVRIVAKAKRWGRFVNWTKGEEEFTTKADTTFKVGEDINLTANFEEYHVGKAYVKDRVVCLPYPMGRVQLFNAIGKMLYDGTGLAIPVSSKGAYILHAEGKNFKVMVP